MQQAVGKLHAPVDRRVLWLIIAITLLGFAVRVIHVSGDSFWFDELLTFDAAQQPIDTILAERAADRPPGYYALEHYAAEWWGNNEFGLRLTSALAGTLTIPLVFVLGSVIANRRVGLWVAALLAVSPFHLRYSQEARGYAIQTMLAVAGIVCVLLALKRRQWRWWIGFGLISTANLYNLFGAFLVIGSQGAFVLALAVVQGLLRKWTRRAIGFALGGLVVAGLLTLLLYGPYLQAALHGVQANIGPDARQSDWYGVPLSDWIVSAQRAFAYDRDILAIALSIIALIGLVMSFVRRNVEAVLWLIIGTLSPLLAITLLGVSRAPLPKYVLFVLPVFLLAVAIGLDEIIGWMTSRARWPLMRYASLIVGLCVVILSLPAITAEHAATAEDWKNILTYVQRVGQEGDVFVPITLDLPDGFNQGEVGLRHYLPQFFSQFQILMGEHLTDPQVADLARAAQSTGNLWVTLYQRNHPVRIADPQVQVIPFQGSFYLVHPPNTDRSALEELTDLYPQLIAQADVPAPQCYLWFDLARLHIQLNQYDEAAAAMAQAPQPCPGSVGIQQALYHYLLDYAAETQQANLVRQTALQLLRLNSKDEAALKAVTLYDLKQMFTTHLPEVTAQWSPDVPIEVQVFTMPQNGDWGEALRLQAPAHISYRLTLPAEPVELRSRIAMAPESWDWGGDGSRFIVRVEDAAGNSLVVFDQYVSNQDADRAWHDVEVPLRQYAGQTITLTLETDPGPQGDTTGDWAGWESPRVVYAVEQ